MSQVDITGSAMADYDFKDIEYLAKVSRCLGCGLDSVEVEIKSRRNFT